MKTNKNNWFYKPEMIFTEEQKQVLRQKSFSRKAKDNAVDALYVLASLAFVPGAMVVGAAYNIGLEIQEHKSNCRTKKREIIRK